MMDASADVVNLARERRVRATVAELRGLLDSDPGLAERTSAMLGGALPCPDLEVSPMADDRVSLTIRVPDSYLDRSDALLDKLDKLYRGPDPLGLWDSVRMSRSLVLRVALDRGLADLEREVEGKPAAAPEKPASAAHKPRPKRPAPPRLATDLVAAGRRKVRRSSRTKPPMTVAGVKIRAWREQEGLKQAEAAERLGVVQSHWSRIERGEMLPGDDVAADLAGLVGDIASDDWTAPNPDASAGTQRRSMDD